jgi:CheY-like chemotaxis protein
MTMADSKPELSSTTIGTGDPLRILLVEDNKDNQMLFRAYLKKLHCTVEIAENGAAGLEKFSAGSFDLVIMDMQMPVMDGYTATRAIRQWEKDQGRNPTPIVALTANAIAQTAEKSLEAGCTVHETKPIHKAQFIELICHYAGGREQ